MFLQITYLGLRLEIHGKSVMNESDCKKSSGSPLILCRKQSRYRRTRLEVIGLKFSVTTKIKKWVGCSCVLYCKIVEVKSISSTDCQKKLLSLVT